MNRLSDDAVSEVVGEMLMIAIVLILAAIFSASAWIMLPADRHPQVNIKMDQPDNENVALWHKGGDWVKSGDLTVICSNKSATQRFRVGDGTVAHFDGYNQPTTKQSFDLGDRLEIDINITALNITEIKLVTSRSVIFTGEVLG
jgi:FlaG/FlaF family flagellin (archaellin)